jgi:hypothetical protein
MSAQVTVKITMGKLLEIRVHSGFRTVEEVDAMFDEVTTVLAANLSPYEKHVTIADWRACDFMSGEAASRLQEGMAKTNPNVIRAAALASQDSPFAVLQFLRIIRESQHEARRLFFEAGPLIAWLTQALTVTEGARLRQFLHE